jgi:RimJ/RimL family protein N-acetyltransferase
VPSFFSHRQLLIRAMPLPTFHTDRLELRTRTMEDFDACLAMDRDPEVVQFVAGPWRDHLEHKLFLKGRIEASFGDGLGYWSIFSKQIPDRFLGWVLLIRKRSTIDVYPTAL